MNNIPVISNIGKSRREYTPPLSLPTAHCVALRSNAEESWGLLAEELVKIL
jgi:hypothetical protein